MICEICKRPFKRKKRRGRPDDTCGRAECRRLKGVRYQRDYRKGLKKPKTPKRTPHYREARKVIEFNQDPQFESCIYI